MAIPFVTINLDKPRRLRFGMGAQVEFEQLTGMKVGELDSELTTGKLSAVTIANVLFCMLRSEDKELTLEKTYELVDEHAGSFANVVDAVTQAMQAAYKITDQKRPNAPKPKKQS